VYKQFAKSNYVEQHVEQLINISKHLLNYKISRISFDRQSRSDCDDDICDCTDDLFCLEAAV